ncbi:hypothetical protein [Sporosarcina sp. P3]|nr:hypothetical protein [Sporosarcina sp. P3]
MIISKKEIEIRKATVEIIKNSDKSTKVGIKACGGLLEISSD